VCANERDRTCAWESGREFTMLRDSESEREKEIGGNIHRIGGIHILRHNAAQHHVCFCASACAWHSQIWAGCFCFCVCVCVCLWGGKRVRVCMFVWGEEGGWCVCVSACACAYVCVCAWVLLCVCTQHIRACHVIVIVIVCVCMLCLRESAFVLHSALGHVVWLCACACACV